MDGKLVWNKRYDIGVEIIDKEHRKLFRILNKLFDFGQQGEKSQWVCQEAVKYFKDHALQHFQDEEDYMESIGCPGLEMHARIHRNFRETTLPALERELEQMDYSENAVEHFFGVCAGWLIGHTLTEDQTIVSGEALGQWENLLPSEEQAVMEQAIVSQLHSMFLLNPQLISNCYGGEKFGNGIYYRLIYRTREKKRWEFFLVFEEKLIVSTMIGVIDTKAKVIDTMMMNATRYTARQFIEYIKKHFPSLTDAEIKEEQLLNYEQFQRIFEKDKPQFSLLFDTGKGYFAYCMTTSDMLADEGKASIIVENAMDQVEKYLNQNRAEKAAAENKKKLLVVDDSEFMLMALQQLLGRDYEVATATSGLAAFRCITLGRPDLILLDYEMPVCNGNQVLEMIRSEKDFADIPIIFLTSRVDKESVKNVLWLKPQGYLSKSLSPELIKKEVDLFFKKKKDADS